ncbi:MAG TPA: helix-turn-helix transcriptional regulator [Acidimicrobiia bacterium]|jgi:transcriptional regulator with XRE-family HTH domain
MATFGETVQAARKEAGLTQARLAELLGMAPSTIRSWEQGRSSPGQAATVTSLAAILGLDEGELLVQAGFEASAAEELTVENRPTVEEALATLAPAAIEVSLFPPADLEGAQEESPVRVRVIEPPRIPITIERVVEVDPSYVEIEEVNNEYRRRSFYTVLVIVVLVLALIYAVGKSSSSFSEWWDSLMDMLDI